MYCCTHCSLDVSIGETGICEGFGDSLLSHSWVGGAFCAERLCTHKHTCVHTNMCTHKHTYICVHTYARILVHTHTCKHAYTQTHTCTHIHTCTHTCNHTCTHFHKARGCGQGTKGHLLELGHPHTHHEHSLLALVQTGSSHLGIQPAGRSAQHTPSTASSHGHSEKGVWQMGVALLTKSATFSTPYRLQLIIKNDGWIWSCNIVGFRAALCPCKVQL